MKAKTLLILTAGLLGMGLIAGGIYITISNLIQPEGLLFEGIVLTSLGFLINLVILIASTIGKTISIFGEILAKQTLIHKELNKVQASQDTGLSGLLKGMMPGGNVIIKDLNNPDTPGRTIPLEGNDFINDLGKILGRGMPMGKKTFQDMNIDELRTALAKAMKKEDYEQAEEINKEITSRNDPDNQEDTTDGKK